MMDIFDLFLTLDRAGPGDAESLRWALSVAGTAPGARVLDAGCGTGADTGTLARALPGARITALDLSPRFADRVRARHPGVTAVAGDMAAPPGGHYDLIWSAGAIYNLGVGPALTAWRPHLAPGGRVAFSDLRWSTDSPPPEAVAHWAAEGLTLTDAAGLDADIAAAGWRLLGARWLGQGGWAAYYDPLDAALAACDNPALTAAFRAEIAAWHRHGAAWDYRIAVVEPAP